jgi:amidase
MGSLEEQLNRLSAVDIAQGIALGRFTAEAVTEACLARIDGREGTLNAWAYLDAEGARARARALDQGPVRGPLHGVPVGIKDVFDTHDMPTQMGSPIYTGHCPANDASVVAMLRAAGAVILGKTVTCEFAGMFPGKTVNPHDSNRTPGGSSSGSAAAVAENMVPVALGTQTGGSVLRPASFCGIVGFKPSFGAVSRVGLKIAAESLDTVGFLARTIDDAALVTDVLTGQALAAGGEIAQAPAIGLCRTVLWETAEEETVAAVEGAAERLSHAGATLTGVDMAQVFAGLAEARDTINAYQRAHAMAFEWHDHRSGISDNLAETLAQGFATPYDAFMGAIKFAESLRAGLDDLFGPNDALLAPCVPGVAPLGLESTGDPALQGLWTILHVPTITLPTYQTADGLPVGIQLVGRPRDDHRLLTVARWVAARAGMK